jgi:oligoribonuclease NrnB/cAMP/cGMP phosphodiesterase (DHH superfamily)
MPKHAFVFHHDLDGFVSYIVLHKWASQHLPISSVGEYYNCNYNTVDKTCKELFENAHKYSHILISDISVSKELAETAPENVHIFDHHDTSSYLKDMRPNYHWESQFCGAAVTWKHLFKGTKIPPEFHTLLKHTNNYDLWKGDNGPAKVCHDLNILVGKYTPNQFLERFYEGFTGFTEEETTYIAEYWGKQKKLYQEAEKQHYGEKVLLLLVNDKELNINFWGNYLLNKGFDVVMMVKTYLEKRTMSLRASKRVTDAGIFHCGNWLQANVMNESNRGGGHANAGGCSLVGISDDILLEYGNKILEVLNHEKLNVKDTLPF